MMLVSAFLNETKAAHLFERCESESALPFCPQNCPQKKLGRFITVWHSFVHMGQKPFWAMVRNTTKPNKITSQRINFEFLITRRSQVQVLSPQPTGCDKKDVTAFLLCCNAKKWRFRRPVFKVVFYKVVQPFHCGWAFFVAVFPQRCARIVEKMSAFVDKSQKDSVVFKKFSIPAVGFPHR